MNQHLKKTIIDWINSNELTTDELSKILHFCTGGDAIHDTNQHKDLRITKDNIDEYQSDNYEGEEDDADEYN